MVFCSVNDSSVLLTIPWMGMDTSGTHQSNGLVLRQSKSQATEIPNNVRHAALLVVAFSHHTFLIPCFSATWSSFHFLMVYLDTERVGEGAVGTTVVPEHISKSRAFSDNHRGRKLEEWSVSPDGSP